MLDGVVIMVLLGIIVVLVIVIKKIEKFQKEQTAIIEIFLQKIHHDIQTVGHIREKTDEATHLQEEKWKQFFVLYGRLFKASFNIHKNITMLQQDFQTSFQNVHKILELLQSESITPKILEEKLGGLFPRLDQIQQSILEGISSTVTKLDHSYQQILQQHQNETVQKLKKFSKWEEQNICQEEKLQKFLQEMNKCIHQSLLTLEDLQKSLQPLFSEVAGWQKNPLARLKDIQKRKIAVFADFENFFISLWDKDLEIKDYNLFKQSLIDPEDKGIYVGEHITFFTNKSRWQRREFYDKKKNISQKDANIIKESLKANGCRIIETDSNIDVPLSLMVISTAQKGEIKEFVIVANDGTYSGLLKELSNMGCFACGILLGEVSGDLVACYKKLGYHRYHLKTREDFNKFGLRTRTVHSLTDQSRNFSSQNRVQSLLTIIHKQRMQFLGATLQETVLQDIHYHICQLISTTRQELIEKVIISLQDHIQKGNLTKTKINNILNILWKSSCFEINKESDDMMILKLVKDCFDYKKFRQGHDAVFIETAWEANIVMSGEEWAKFLYESDRVTPELLQTIENTQKKYSSVEEYHVNIPVSDLQNLSNTTQESEKNPALFSSKFNVTKNKILAVIRKQKMQFLGAELQDEVLRKIHTFLLENKKVLRNNFPKDLEVYFQSYIESGQISKTKIIGLIAILRKNQSIEIYKDNQDYAYISLSPAQYDYSKFRQAHDEVFVRTALIAGLDVSEEDWSILLYEDLCKLAYFRTIIKEQKEWIQNSSVSDIDDMEE